MRTVATDQAAPSKRPSPTLGTKSASSRAKPNSSTFLRGTFRVPRLLLSAVRRRQAERIDTTCAAANTAPAFVEDERDRWESSTADWASISAAPTDVAL